LRESEKVTMSFLRQRKRMKMARERAALPKKHPARRMPLAVLERLRADAVEEARRKAKQMEEERLAALSRVDPATAGVDPNTPWDEK
jgi:hypothetical protein